jgi:hypothetical protein
MDEAPFKTKTDPTSVKGDTPDSSASAQSAQGAFQYEQLEAALPQVFRLCPGGILRKLLNELAVYHRWGGFALHGAENHSRLMRLVALAAQVLVAGSLQAAMFVYSDPDDGKCTTWANERACIQEQSGYVQGETLCFWEQSGHSCHFRQPAASFQLIIIVAGLSAVIACPVARLLEWVMLKFLVLEVPAPAPAPARGEDGTSAKPGIPSPAFSLASLGSYLPYWGGGRVVPVGPVVLEQTAHDLDLPLDLGSGPFPIAADAHTDIGGQLSLEDRQHCVSFINAQPLQLELESFSRNFGNFSDSLTFLGTNADRVNILRKKPAYPIYTI